MNVFFIRSILPVEIFSEINKNPSDLKRIQINMYILSTVKDLKTAMHGWPKIKFMMIQSIITRQIHVTKKLVDHR